MHPPPRALPWLILLTLTTSLSLAFEDTKQQPCTIESASGKYYDLTSLQAKKDYEVATETDRKFVLNVCTHVVSETWNIDKPEEVAGYFRGAHSDISIGTVNTTLHVVNENPVIILGDGSKCPGTPDLKASSVIRFICDRSVSSPGQPQLVAQLPPGDESACAFFFEWRTPAACPTSKKTGAATVLAVFSSILLIALLVYFIGATAYNHIVLGVRGWDILPRISIFSVHDTYALFEKCFPRNNRERPGWGSWGRNGRGMGGGYMAPEEQSMIGHPYEDDDEEETQLPRSALR